LEEQGGLRITSQHLVIRLEAVEGLESLQQTLIVWEQQDRETEAVLPFLMEQLQGISAAVVVAEQVLVLWAAMGRNIRGVMEE
jgi:hypothetical protein